MGRGSAAAVRAGCVAVKAVSATVRAGSAAGDVLVDDVLAHAGGRLTQLGRSAQPNVCWCMLASV